MKKVAKKTVKKDKLKADKKMTFNEAIAKFPSASEIFEKRGMHCVHCMMASMETIEDGCKAHGMSDEDIKGLIDELNS